MPRRIQAPLFAWSACVLALIALVLAAYAWHPAEVFDARTLVHFSVPLESDAYRALEGIARLADPLPLLAMLAAICGFALAFGRRRAALGALVVVAGANLTTQILKGLLAHPRYQPYFGYSQPWTDAFPSGHATAAASIAVALMLAVPRRHLPLAALAGGGFAGLVGIAVIALEWHYPSDVLGGFLVAAGWGFAALATGRALEGEGGGGGSAATPGRSAGSASAPRFRAGGSAGPAPSFRG